VFAKHDRDLLNQVHAINAIDNATHGNPTPDQVKQRNDAVQKIVDIGTEGKSDAGTEIAVGKALVSVKESKRAIPFAENAVNLARQRGDRKTLVAALGVSADAYGKSGDYALATERAKQALELDPTDSGARFLYSTYKDRSAASADALGPAAPAPTAAAPAPASGGSPAGAAPAPPARAPAVGTIDAQTLAAGKALSEGERMLALDPKKALEKFDEAVKEAPTDPRVLAARAQARLAAGDAAGALEDAQASVAAGGGGASFAVRAEAEKALGRSAQEVADDLARAAALDPDMAELYKRAVDRIGGPQAQGAAGGASAGGAAAGAASGPGYGLVALAQAWPLTTAAAAGVLLALLAGLGLWVKRRMTRAFEVEPRTPPPPLYPR
jgi:tetratricopeptide (TPR) repeat protein